MLYGWLYARLVQNSVSLKKLICTLLYDNLTEPSLLRNINDRDSDFVLKAIAKHLDFTGQIRISLSPLMLEVGSSRFQL